MLIPNEFNGYGPDGRRRYYKGGGGGGGSQAYYANLDALYSKQSAQLDKLMAIQDRYVVPGYGKLADTANETGTVANQNAAAGAAGSAVAEEYGRAKADTSRQLTSMGVNPNDPRFAATQHAADVSAAADIGNAKNTARTNQVNLGFARQKDVVGMGMGVPGQASETMSSMNSTLGAGQSSRNQQAQMDQQAGMGLAQGAMYALYAKDGGFIKRKGGAPRFASGGFFANSNATPAPPMSAPMRPQQRGSGLGVAPFMAMGGGGGLSRIMEAPARWASRLDSAGGAIGETVGKMLGDGKLQNWGIERQALANGAGANATEIGAGLSPAEAATAADAYSKAGMSTIASDISAGAGAEAAADAGAAAATQGSMTGILSGAAAALPWVAGAYAVGSLLDMFADGGEVKSRKPFTAGGKVNGPGTDTSDSVAAWLSDGEYVLNADAVDMIGKHNLDKINHAGLQRRHARG